MTREAARARMVKGFAGRWFSFGFRQASFGSYCHILFAPVGAAIRLGSSTASHHANTRDTRLKIHSPEFPPNHRPRTGHARLREPGRLRRRRTFRFLRQTIEDPAG